MPRFYPRADSTRPAFAGDRQYLRRCGHDRALGRAGLRQTRRPHSGGFVWLGAGSDAFLFRATEALAERQRLALTTQDYIARRTEIDYGMYVRLRGKLAD